MFKLSEFACKCGRDNCDAEHMTIETLNALNELRKLYGKPLYITSARRCEYQNNKCGGAENSYHLIGAAVDIKVTSGTMMGQLVELSMRVGFRGFGIAKTFLHLDTRASNNMVVFTY
jgi:uncharacterized protein YcbK (DUF882 family)